MVSSLVKIMKRILLLIIVGLGAIPFFNCQKQDIMLYNDGHYIQFTGSWQDTTILSFFFHPGKEEVDIGFPVRLVGHMLDTDLEYFIEVDQTQTTAGEANFNVRSSYRFRTGRQVDTAYVTFRKTPNLQSEEVRLAFYIRDTPNVKAGQTEYIYQIVKINDMVSKPNWWDTNMDRYYLGVYSEAKYRTFMEVTGVGDMSQYDEHQRRIFMLQFKYYLLEMKENGKPLLLEDGSDMLDSVPLIG